MALSKAEINTRPQIDQELVSIAEYTAKTSIQSKLALETARYCLMDAIGCAILALQYPACTKLLGPIVPQSIVPDGARVIGTNYVLDPIMAAFNIGTMIRWLDFNDTWLAAEWGHPSDNLGAILAVSDYVSRQNLAQSKSPLTVHDVLIAMVKAHEIQGIIALENSFNRLGYDHVFLVKLASTALSTFLLDGNINEIANGLSQAFVDGAVLRTYRHAPNTGSRKSWAAGDATSRGVRLAWLTMQGELGYPSALTASKWGFYDVIMGGKALKLNRPFGSYVMENVLFKIAYPAEFHAQTAVECAILLHPQISNRLEEIEKIVISTQESAIRIISKSGALYNPADRDHCLQYMVAIALIYGELTAEYYEDVFAQNPVIDQLRHKMLVQEDQQFSKDYLDSNKRSIANAIQIYFKDGTKTNKITVEFPIGHPRRRDEGLPLLFQKFENNMQTTFSDEKIATLISLFKDEQLLNWTVPEFIDLFVTN